jgi:hypothetical protein
VRSRKAILYDGKKERVNKRQTMPKRLVARLFLVAEDRHVGNHCVIPEGFLNEDSNGVKYRLTSALFSLGRRLNGGSKLVP